MSWWNDIWLNEGFATWMETKPVAELKPEWGIAQDSVASVIQAMRIDSLKATRPIRTNAETSAQINELFDAIAYNKTAAVLRMIEAYVTPAQFRNGVNQYLQAHAYGNATAEDFWTKVAQVTGKPVDGIMQSYVDQPGVPIVSVKCSKGTDSVSQQRFFLESPQGEAAKSQVWTIPVCMKNASSGQTSCELVSKPVQSVASNNCNEATDENAGAEGYYRSGYTPEQVAALAKVVQKLSPPERLSLLANEWALARTGEHQISSYLDLTAALSTDGTHGVWDETARNLEFLNERLVPDSLRGSYEQWVRKFAGPIMQQVGWSARPQDSYETKKVRADAFLVLGYLGHEPKAVAEARKLVHEYIKEPTSVDPMLSEAAFRVAASQGDTTLYNEILAALSSAKTPGVYYRYLYALTEFRQPELVQKTLELAFSDRVRSQDMPIMMIQMLQNPAGRETTWKYVQTHWPEVQKRASIWGSALIVRGTGTFCSASSEQNVRQFFYQHDVPEAQRTLKQSLESISDCVRFKQAQEGSLSAWVSSGPAGSSGQ